jgi:ABC-type glycerol-3-phosphate transport system substrate-binding protein
MVKKIQERPKILIIAAAVVIGLVLFLLARPRGEEFSAQYEGYDLNEETAGRTNTYTRYRERHAQYPAATKDIPIDILSWDDAEGVSVLDGFAGEDRALRTGERGFVEYTVRCETAGLYNLYMEYYPLESRGINIERGLKINGEVPFLGAERLVFYRVWGDAPGGRRFDNQGNEVRPSQVETPLWESVRFTDSMGYSADPYRFYFNAGDNTVRLEGINEPAAIRSLALKAPAPGVSYAEYLAGFDQEKFRNSDTSFMLKIQGEDAIRRSDPSLYAVYDRSSGATDPPSAAKIRLNMIGGQNWKAAGQWIEWEFEVPEDGIYRITVKGRQNYNRGYVSNRSVMINGVIPSRELAAVPFKFDNRWKLVTLMSFPLNKGRNTLRIQATLGELGGMLNTIEESVYRLNAVYRRIMVLTGAEPDIYRDYLIDMVYPDVITAMELESRILYRLVDTLTAYSGERNAQTALILTLARQLEFFVSRPDKIPSGLVNFKQNISGLGDTLLTLTQSQLDIDYILVSAGGAKIPPVRENFFVNAGHEIRSFFASFFVDYNNLGDVYKGADIVNVWILTGRDQSNILKTMIDDTFTPKTGIMVNVRLVTPDALMPAVVAGTGPDAVLSVPQGDPVNYAVRNAAMDISRFDNFDDVIRDFNRSVIVPFEFAGGVYALPETQSYQVMFYRRDIFEELNIPVPETWDDVISILPVIQRNNMNVGIPSLAGAPQAGAPQAGNDFSGFLTHLYQRDSTLYNGEGSRTLLDNETAIEAFDLYTKFFTHYKTPMVFDFANRFRTGEMPLGFADYTVFNTLEVFAPEIRGLWGFARMPGIKQPDGSIQRSVPAQTIASMMFSKTKRPELTWEFLKWWVSSETQLRFGRELESVMGAAARYPTANYEAFKRLPWGSEQMAVLDEQREWTVGTPEVPGGYYVNRHIANAIRRILNENTDARETLLDYSITINDELRKKRKEFGLE